MWQQIFLGLLGLCSGTIIASGVAGLLIGLSIIPRYAGITHTADHILLYEDMCFLGIFLGNLFCLFRFPLPLGTPFLLLFGVFSGIFLGGWILALAEVADMFPVFYKKNPSDTGTSSYHPVYCPGKTDRYTFLLLFRVAVRPIIFINI